MDGDDYCFPERFEKQLAYLQDHPRVNMIGTRYRVMGYSHANERPTRYDDIKVHLLEDNCVCHPTIMIQKDVLERTGLVYDLDYETVEDYKFFADMIEVGEVETIDQVLLDYRVHPSQTSAGRAKYQVEMADRVRLLMLDKVTNVGELTTEQKELHLCFIKSRINSSTSLKRQKRWISFLMDENQKRNFFDHNYLHKFLTNKLAINTRIYFTTKHRLRFSNLVFLVTHFRTLKMAISRKELLKYTLKYFIPGELRSGLNRLRPTV